MKIAKSLQNRDDVDALQIPNKMKPGLKDAMTMTESMAPNGCDKKYFI